MGESKPCKEREKRGSRVREKERKQIERECDRERIRETGREIERGRQYRKVKKKVF